MPHREQEPNQKFICKKGVQEDPSNAQAGCMYVQGFIPAQWSLRCRQLTVARQPRPGRRSLNCLVFLYGTVSGKLARIRATLRGDSDVSRHGIGERLSRAFCWCITRPSGLLFWSAMTRCFQSFVVCRVFLSFWAFSVWKLSRKSKNDNETVFPFCLVLWGFLCSLLGLLSRVPFVHKKLFFV